MGAVESLPVIYHCAVLILFSSGTLSILVSSKIQALDRVVVLMGTYAALQTTLLPHEESLWNRNITFCSFMCYLFPRTTFVYSLMKAAIQLVDLSSLFTRETTFVTSCLLFCTQSPFWKAIDSKRKEFAPKGSKFFSFREFAEQYLSF